MSYLEEYNRWLRDKDLDPELLSELEQMKEEDRKEAFVNELAFGTAGLRGIMGAGTNRMNIYTVAYTTKALAQRALSLGGGKVAICYDCRNNSQKFACVAAWVLLKEGLEVLLFKALRPTPELSFSVIHYGCIYGINITASHNPKLYNGYKVYASNGAQITNEEAKIISTIRSEIDPLSVLESSEIPSVRQLQSMGATILTNDTDGIYLNAVKQASILPEAPFLAPDLKIVYTPFHGTGRKLVPDILSQRGFKNVYTVGKQMVVDGNFSTVASPNPEEVAGYAMAIDVAKKFDADLILATDPDADRVGVAVKNGTDKYVTLTGNQIGILLTDFIMNVGREKGKLPENPTVITTIVSTMMARVITEKNGGKFEETFTGFRFIAEKAEEMEKRGYHFVFGFEESYGFLSGNHAKDKDAVVAVMLIAELASYHASKGRTLYQALEDIMNRYGWYSEKTINVQMPGLDGLEKMQKLMESLRKNPPKSVSNYLTYAVYDYLSGTKTRITTNETEKLQLSGSNVLAYEFENGCKIVIRPSGTEPKIKLYILVKANSKSEAEKILDDLILASQKLFENS